MRRDGILHPQLAAALAALGHTDTLVVADRGLPLPDGPETVQLAVVPGVPAFSVVLQAVLAEIVCQSAMVAAETPADALWLQTVREAVPEVTEVPHEELKRLTWSARLVIRTGESVPYSNIVLRCGVPF
ncbi:MAG: ABC-type ribose transport system, auxiliary component [Frankiales bacterium]|jgi:D-ribose pyranase|nr:ABC-type ribose transport system, auxiliary component [Frankiales bacterium]